MSKKAKYKEKAKQYRELKIPKPNRSIAVDYRHKVIHLIQEAVDVFAAAFIRNPKEWSKEPFEEVIQSKAEQLASWYVNRIVEWTSSKLDLPKLITSYSVEEATLLAIQENVNLITGLGDDTLKNIQTIITNETLFGEGVEVIKNQLQHTHKMIERRANLIAYDQTRKLTAVVTNERAKDAGITKFRWLHSRKDAQPRTLHQKLNGQVFEYNDPPVIETKPLIIKGLPGQLINCKCQAVPLIEV